MMKPSECLRGAGTRDKPLRMSAWEASQGSAESEDENRDDALICTFQKQCTIFRMLCFEKKTWKDKINALYGHVAYKSIHYLW